MSSIETRADDATTPKESARYLRRSRRWGRPQDDVQLPDPDDLLGWSDRGRGCSSAWGRVSRVPGRRCSSLTPPQALLP